jgi:hypothetical protein
VHVLKQFTVEKLCQSLISVNMVQHIKLWMTEGAAVMATLQAGIQGVHHSASGGMVYIYTGGQAIKQY